MAEDKPTIGIVGGKGKMGNWFKNFFEKEGLKVIISDKDTKLSNKELAKLADIVIVSVPIDITIKVIKEIRESLKKDALFCDLTSLKMEPVREMKKAKSGVLGMHPLFGPLADNLEGQTIVFCPERKNKWVEFLKKIFKKNKAKIIEISPKEHDWQMAFLQSLLHFSNISFSHFLYSQNFRPKPSLLTPVFRLQSLVLGRILSQDPKLYGDIEMKNPYFKKFLKKYLKEISSFGRDISEQNHKNFQKKFKESASHFLNFIKIAQTKTSQILKMMEKQPIKIGKIKKINLKKGKIGFLGPIGTFSWVAGKLVFKNNVQLISFPTIEDIFEALLNHEVDLGIVPIQNTIGGLVSETLQSFIEFPVYTLGSFKIPIHHCLLSRAKKLKEIKIVKSHPQALSQCRIWLEKNLSNVIKEPTSSTISPILENLSKNTGFIAPFESRKIFKLNVLAKNIEDTKENFTRFFLISSEIRKSILRKLKLKANNTLLLLSVYDRVGILRDILDVFAKRGINLTALHSIPSYFHPWDYLFFLEIEKSYFSHQLKDILKELEKYCPFIRIVGMA